MGKKPLRLAGPTLLLWRKGNIRGVGGRQDDLVVRCRMEVKILRQHAAMEMARNPKAAPIAREIRTRTQKILRGKYGHEGR